MHGPEFDYLVPGETTIVTTHVVADYAHALVSAARDLIRNDDALVRRLVGPGCGVAGATRTGGR